MDFDGDGVIDILSGSGSPDGLHLFRGAGKGLFQGRQTIAVLDGMGKTEMGLGSALAHPGGPTPRPLFTADWDDDGDLDLIVVANGVWLVPNEGTRQEHAFGKPRRLVTEDKPISTQGEGSPCVVDWDRDGKLDLLLGGHRGVVFYRNIGSNKAPKLAAAATLLSGPVTAICANDWNEDGLLDLIVGQWGEPRLLVRDGQKRLESHSHVVVYLRQLPSGAKTDR